MNKVRIGLCQLLVGSDKAKNLANAALMVNKAAEAGAKIVMLPECFNSPYSTSSFAEYAEVINMTSQEANSEAKSPSVHMILSLAKKHNIYLVGGSIPETEGGKIFNTSLVVDPEGKLIARHRKMHLFDIDIPGKQTFKESDVLTAGDTISTFDTIYGKCGLGICYDLRFPEYAQLCMDSCRMMFYPGAFNTTTGPAHWELLLRARAVDNQCFVAAASPARDPNVTYQAWGHSSVISPWGKVVATTEHDEALVLCDLELSEVETLREQIPVRKQRRNDKYKVSML